jgi:hypothetical protein
MVRVRPSRGTGPVGPARDQGGSDPMWRAPLKQITERTLPRGEQFRSCETK